MSGETEKQVSGWTTDTSREDILKTVSDLEKYVERRFTDQDRAVQAALQSSKEAVDKSEMSYDKRFEAANEVKATFSGDLAKKLDRTEYESNHRALEDKIDALTDRMNRNDGKGAGIAAGWGYLAGAIGLVATIIGVILAFNG